MREIVLWQHNNTESTVDTCWDVYELGPYGPKTFCLSLADAKAEAIRLAHGENARVRMHLRSYAVDYVPPNLDDYFPSAVTEGGGPGRDDYRIAFLPSTGSGAVGLA
jgi:hypothetical protein